jgi:hypothetical protein
MSITIHIPPCTSRPQHSHSITTSDSVASGQAPKITEEPSAFERPKHHNCAALLLVYKAIHIPRAIQMPGAASVTRPRNARCTSQSQCHSHPSQHLTTCRVTLPCSCENRRERRCRTQCQCCGGRHDAATTCMRAQDTAARTLEHARHWRQDSCRDLL